jgi:hypothetical protein
MRTTLSIDDDVLAAARELASSQHSTVGEVISRLARKALRFSPPEVRTRNGIPLLEVKPNSPPVTSELVRHLREELP